MSLRYRTVTVGGANITVRQCCPFDGLTNLTFPVYLNHYNASGLVQPYGSIGDNGTIVVSGIVRPAWNPLPSGATGNFRAAPSGLTHTVTMGYANGTDGFGLDQHTYYKDINYYQNYWTCPSGHFFIYPSGLATDLPVNYATGNVSDTTPMPWSNFE